MLCAWFVLTDVRHPETPKQTVTTVSTRCKLFKKKSHFHCSTQSQPPPSLVVVTACCGGCVCASKPGWGTCWALSNISRPICCGLQKLLYCTYRRVGGGCDEPTVGTHRCVKGASILLSPSLSFPRFISHFSWLWTCFAYKVPHAFVTVHLSACACVLCHRPVIKSHCT